MTPDERELVAEFRKIAARLPDPSQWTPKNPSQGLRFLALWFDAIYEDTGSGRDEVQQSLRKWANQLDADEQRRKDDEALMRQALKLLDDAMACDRADCCEPECALARALRARLGPAPEEAAKGPNFSTDADLLEREPGLLREITFAAPPFDSHHEEARWALLSRFGMEVSDLEVSATAKGVILGYPSFRRASVALVLATLYRGQVHSRPDAGIEQKAQHYARVYEDETAKVRLIMAPAPEVKP